MFKRKFKIFPRSSNLTKITKKFKIKIHNRLISKYLLIICKANIKYKYLLIIFSSHNHKNLIVEIHFFSLIFFICICFGYIEKLWYFLYVQLYLKLVELWVILVVIYKRPLIVVMSFWINSVEPILVIFQFYFVNWISYLTTSVGLHRWNQ